MIFPLLVPHFLMTASKPFCKIWESFWSLAVSMASFYSNISVLCNSWGNGDVVCGKSPVNIMSCSSPPELLWWLETSFGWRKKKQKHYLNDPDYFPLQWQDFCVYLCCRVLTERRSQWGNPIPPVVWLKEETEGPEAPGCKRSSFPANARQ